MSKLPPPSAGMSLEEMVREMYDRMLGDGTEANPGLSMRVDRLEAKQKILGWVAGILGGVGLTALGNWVWGRISSGGRS